MTTDLASNLSTAGRLLQARAALTFELLSIPRKPSTPERDEERAEKERQLAALDAEVDRRGVRGLTGRGYSG